MGIKKKDRVFFFIQSLLKYSSLPFMQKFRIFLYRFFFKEIGKGVVIKDGITFKFPSDISIGDGVKIAENCYIVGLGGLKIGSHTLIGAGTKIVTTSHNFTDISIPVSSQGISYKKITIESNVWLGFNVVILSGSFLKQGTIIGASAVVVGEVVQENAIMVGIPAKILKIRN